MNTPQTQQAVCLRVRGCVQGVGFRHATCAQAEKLSLRGWVRNRTDGSVEILAVGNADACTALARWAHSGPPAAHVLKVEPENISPKALSELSDHFIQAATV